MADHALEITFVVKPGTALSPTFTPADATAALKAAITGAGFTFYTDFAKVNLVAVPEVPGEASPVLVGT